MMPSFNREEPYHRVLVIDFNYNDWWIVSQLAGLPKQLHIVKHQQLVPCRAKSLAQDLQHTYTHINSVYLPFLSLVVIQAHTRTNSQIYTHFESLTSVTWLCVEKKTLAKWAERPLLSAANRLRAWYMCALS